MTEPVTLSDKQPSGITRRELLNYAWLASLGVLTAQIAGISIYFSLPRFREGEFGGVFKIGTMTDLPTVDSAPENYPEGKFWLVRTEAGLMAIYKVCTHLDCLFNWDNQEGKFVCPCHGSQFERDGAYISGPAARSLDRLVVQMVSPEGTVLMETNSETGEPLPIPDLPQETGLEEVAVENASDSQAGNDSAGFDEETLIQVDTGRKILGRPLVS